MSADGRGRPRGGAARLTPATRLPRPAGRRHDATVPSSALAAPHASALVTAGVAGLSVALLVTWPALVWRAAAGRPDRSAVTARAAIGLGAWALVTIGLAASGALARVDARPPPFVAIPVGLAVVVAIALRSRAAALLAEAMPLSALVAVQAFRLPLELVMHAAALEGTMPPQMTFGSALGATGWNYDVVMGATALLLAIALRRGAVPRAIVLAWNAMGLALVIVIASIGIASTPLLARFGATPDRLNTWILFPPFVWLPAVLVGSALFGHAIVLRKLLAGRASTASPART